MTSLPNPGRHHAFPCGVKHDGPIYPLAGANFQPFLRRSCPVLKETPGGQLVQSCYSVGHTLTLPPSLGMIVQMAFVLSNVRRSMLFLPGRHLHPCRDRIPVGPCPFYQPAPRVSHDQEILKAGQSPVPAFLHISTSIEVPHAYHP